MDPNNMSARAVVCSVFPWVSEPPLSLSVRCGFSVWVSDMRHAAARFSFSLGFHEAGRGVSILLCVAVFFVFTG